MARSRLPSRYAKVQVGLHALAVVFALGTIGAAARIASLGYGYGGTVALVFVSSIWALALDTWEIVALTDSTRSRRRLPALHPAVVELLTVGVCIGFLFVGIGHVTIPCNMDAPITDCPEPYQDVLWRHYRVMPVMLGFGFGLFSIHGIFFILAVVELVSRRRKGGHSAAY